MARSGRRHIRGLLFVFAAVVSVFLTGCGGGGGVHTQTPTSAPRSSAVVSYSTSTGPSGLPSVSAGSGLPTPTVGPAGQDAVDAYIALANAYNKASIDPDHADLAEINKYLTAKAAKIFDNSITSMKSAGQAYKGTPADPRVRVQTVFSPRSVFLTSCPAERTKDPFVEFYVSTGKPVPITKRSPPPPYRLTLPMRLIGSQWKLADLIQDASKTCTG